MGIKVKFGVVQYTVSPVSRAKLGPQRGWVVFWSPKRENVVQIAFLATFWRVFAFREQHYLPIKLQFGMEEVYRMG